MNNLFNQKIKQNCFEIIFSLIINILFSYNLTAQQTWNVFNENNSDLPNNTVRVIEIDHFNRKWIGTDFGLAVYNDSSWTVFDSSNSPLANAAVRSIHIDKNNHVWVGTMSSGLFKYDGLQWINFNPANSGIPDYYVRAIAVDSLNRKWIGTVEGLAMYNDSSWQVWTTANSDLFSNNISSIRVGTDNRITAGTINGGIAVIYDSTMLVYSRNNGSGIPDNSVAQITFDSSENYWFASPAAGIFADFGGPDWMMYNMSNSGMPVNASTCIFIDENDRQYIGTEQNGIAKRVMPDIWTYYTTVNSGLPDDYIHFINKDKNGIIWIGTHNHGLVSLIENSSAAENISSDNFVVLYPNPSNDFTNFRIDNFQLNEVEVFDLLGKKYSVEKNIDNNYCTLNLNSIQKGVFILLIHTDQGVKVSRFTKI
jgi:ligand-binding sensor domain-containing protein